MLSMAMLPHGTMVAMTNNNVPALHVVTLPWNVYEAGCNTIYEIEENTADTADYFKSVAKRNGIKVSNPRTETGDTHGAAAKCKSDAADNFKAVARRNGIKVLSPNRETDETRGATANLSPSATEFVPRHAAAPEVLPEDPQPATLPLCLPSTTSGAGVSPVNEDTKLLEMFQEVISEKKEQYKILQSCMQDKEKSERTIKTLTDEKNELSEKVAKLKSDLKNVKERNSLLSEEVEALTERLIETEETNTRLKSQVTTLTNKLQETESSQESDRTMVTSLFNRLNEAEAAKERAWSLVEGFSSKYDALLKDNESAESRAAMLADQLNKNKLDKDKVEAEMYSVTCELKELRFEKERKKDTTVKELTNSTGVTLSSEKKRPLEKKMDSLDNFNALDDDDDQNWTVVQKKTRGEKLTRRFLPCKSQSGKKLKVTRSHSLDDAMLGGNDGLCSSNQKKPQKRFIPPLMPESWYSQCSAKQHSNAPPNFLSKPDDVPQNSSFTAKVEAPKIEDTVTPPTFEVNSDTLNTTKHPPIVPSAQEPTCNQVIPTKRVTAIESSQRLTSTTKTTTTTETFFSEKINISSPDSAYQTPSNSNTSADSKSSALDSLTEQFGLGPKGATLSDGTEGCFSYPLFDPAVIDLSCFQTHTQPFGQSIPPFGLRTNPLGFTGGLLFGSSQSNLQPKDLTKPSSKTEKAKAKKNLASFDILMDKLSEKFPSKTRNELIMLLKLAKATFGDQGFRKKKIEEIVKRVGEVIAAENKNVTENSAQICSICREEMKNKETVLECGHEFHAKCVKEWINTERTCPLCRSHALTEEDFPTLG